MFAPTGVPLRIFSSVNLEKVPRHLLSAARLEKLDYYAVRLVVNEHVEPRGPAIPQPEQLLTRLRGTVLFGKDRMAVFALENSYVGGEIYGWQDAASLCFAKSPEELTLADAATLLLHMRSPSSNWDNRAGELLERRNAFIERMAENGHVTQEVATAAIANALVHCGN